MRRIDPSFPSLRVAVLAGGDSAERPVSLESGAAVAKALQQRGHRVTQTDTATLSVDRVDWSDYDVAFLALHGAFGEDGQVQALLEERGVPYTGSDAAASRLAFSKSASKERFAQHGVPTLPYVLFHESDGRERLRHAAATLGYPLIVKPNTQGSSLGVSIVHQEIELDAALAECFRYDLFGILEPYVSGTEWTVGLIDEIVLPPIQITTPRAFYDYQAKYVDDTTRYLFDADLPASVLAQITDAGCRAGAAIGTSGIARVDLMLDRQQSPWVLEVNTIPGFTSHSLIPKAAARIGIDFADLCERALKSCLSRTIPPPHSPPSSHITPDPAPSAAKHTLP